MTTTPLSDSYWELGTFIASARYDNGVVVAALHPDGWGSPAVTLDAQQRAGQLGAWAGDSFLAARPITLSGTIAAPTAELASTTLDDLIAAASLDGATLTVHEGTVSRFLTVRRAREVLADWRGDRAVAFSVGLVALDPRKTVADMSGSTGLPEATGGLTLPFTVPFTIASTITAGQITLTNAGNVAGRMVVRIDGPVTAPRVTHVSSGKVLVFAASMSLADGEWVEIDMDARTVLANGTASRNGWVTSREWFAFEPGINVIAVSASVDSEALFTVTGTPSWG